MPVKSFTFTAKLSHASLALAMPDLGLYDDMDALLSPAEPRSDAVMTVAIRAEAALAADRKLEADIKASAAAKAAADDHHSRQRARCSVPQPDRRPRLGARR